MSSAIMGQMVAFALMLALGLLCARIRIATRASLPSAIALATKVFLPAMIFSVMCQSLTRDLVVSHFTIIVLAVLFYALVIGIMRLLAALLHLNGGRSAAFRMVFIFGNTGFIGLPVLVTAFPETGAVNLMLFMLVDQVVFWTYGVMLAQTEGHSVEWRKMIKGFFNPNIVAMMIAFGLIFADVPVSRELISFMDALGAAATPLCMVCLGVLCYFSDIGRVLRCKEVYVGAFVKMVLLPLCLVPIFRFLPVPFDISTSMILMAGMPATVLVPLIVEASGGDAPYATSLSVATVAFSVLTLPLVSWFVVN